MRRLLCGGWRGLHDTMVDSIGNEILSEIYRVNSLHVRLIRLDAGLVRPMRIVPAMEEHLAFIAALRARDEDKAIKSISEHIERSRARVLDAMLGSNQSGSMKTRTASA